MWGYIMVNTKNLKCPYCELLWKLDIILNILCQWLHHHWNIIHFSIVWSCRISVPNDITANLLIPSNGYNKTQGAIFFLLWLYYGHIVQECSRQSENIAICSRFFSNNLIFYVLPEINIWAFFNSFRCGDIHQRTGSSLLPVMTYLQMVPTQKSFTYCGLEYIRK